MTPDHFGACFGIQDDRRPSTTLLRSWAELPFHSEHHDLYDGDCWSAAYAAKAYVATRRETEWGLQ